MPTRCWPRWGRERPAQTIAPVVEALSSMDAGWVLRDRSEHEVKLVADALSNDGYGEYVFRLLPYPL